MLPVLLFNVISGLVVDKCTDLATEHVEAMIDDILPDKAKKYIYALEDFVEAKISSVSTSPEREDTILMVDPFKF